MIEFEDKNLGNIHMELVISWIWEQQTPLHIKLQCQVTGQLDKKKKWSRCSVVPQKEFE